MLIFWIILQIINSQDIIITQSYLNYDVDFTLTKQNVEEKSTAYVKITFKNGRENKITQTLLLSLPEFSFDSPDFSYTSAIQTLTVTKSQQKISYGSSTVVLKSFSITINNIINPINSGTKKLSILIVNGGTTYNQIINFEIKSLDSLVINQFNAKTFEKSDMSIQISYDFFLLQNKKIMLELFYMLLVFQQGVLSNIDCSDFKGVSNSNYCYANGNQIYIYNTFPTYLFYDNSISFTLHNIPAPPNLELNTCKVYLYNNQTLLTKGQFKYQASSPNSIEFITIQSSDDKATRSTQLTLYLSSYYYLLSQSDIVLQLDKYIQINSLSIGDQNQQFTQNQKTITITKFNSKELDEFSVKLDLFFTNLDYKQDVDIQIAINNISPCLIGDIKYSIAPNEYKSFTVSRNNEITSQQAIMQVDIVLNNPINNGDIFIQFPSELNLQDVHYQNQNGNIFSYTFNIINPETVCETSSFSSQAYEDNKFKEQLYKQVTLIQQTNNLLQDLLISLNETQTNSIVTMQVFLNTQFNIYIEFDQTFAQSQIQCSNCQQVNYQKIILSTNNNSISNILTPRTMKPQTLIISIYQQQCQQSQGTYELQFQPIQITSTCQVTNRKFSQTNQWLFNLELPTEIFTTDKLQIIYPQKLIYQQYQYSQCQILYDSRSQFQCNTQIDGLVNMNKKQIFQLAIGNVSNPEKDLELKWQFILLDENDYQIAIFTCIFKNWEYNILPNSNIYLLDYKLRPMMEALLRINISFPIDKFTYQGNYQIFCENCQNIGDTIEITEIGTDYIEIPFRFFTNQDQVSYQFEYKIITYKSQKIQEVGEFKQMIRLLCIDGCGLCQGTHNYCLYCLNGYLFNNTCITECPNGYYNLNNTCQPCLISSCSKCGYFNYEICIECKKDLQLFKNQCIIFNYSAYSNNTQNQTNNNSSSTQNSIQTKKFQVKYNFPGILLFIFFISAFTVISKILNHSTISKTMFYSLLSILESGIGIFIFIYFLIFALYNFAILSVSLLCYQLVLQINAMSQLKPYLMLDGKFQNYKKENQSIKLVYYISFGFNYIFFLIQTSKLNQKPCWNADWQYQKEILLQIATSLRQSLVYSTIQITIIITAILELRELQTLFIEILGVNLVSIGLNFYHQYKFNMKNTFLLN